MPAHTQWLFNLRHSGTKLLNEFHIASIDTYVLDTYLHTTSVVQVDSLLSRGGGAGVNLAVKSKVNDEVLSQRVQRSLIF